MKVAIIGSGISGMGAAYLLKPHHEITLFESSSQMGGHSRTLNIDVDGENVNVDTGFIVFNKQNYPHLTALFERLNVPIAKSNMSFGVNIDNGRFEYGTRHKMDMFAQKTNLLRPSFWQMLLDILRFNKKAREYLEQPNSFTVGEMLKQLGVHQLFSEYYLCAMGAAIWSTPSLDMLNFPANTLVRFFENHGLLSINDHPQWYTVKGGSQVYVDKIKQSLGNSVKTNCSIIKIERHVNEVVVTDDSGTTHQFDSVVLACHSDQALALLSDASNDERAVLGQIAYQPNRVVLHSDTSFMPCRKQAWSSWNYLGSSTQEDKSISLTYWMNNLQPLCVDKPVLVTLNPGHEPMAHKVYNQTTLHHPVFNQQAIKAQSKLPSIQGQSNTWFCGAWTRYGFHEDGLLSAVKVAKSMGATIPWQ